jgi:hypothetical protein
MGTVSTDPGRQDKAAVYSGINETNKDVLNRSGVEGMLAFALRSLV